MKFHSRFQVPWKNKRKQILRNVFCWINFIDRNLEVLRMMSVNALKPEVQMNIHETMLTLSLDVPKTIKFMNEKKCVNLSLYYEFITPRQLFTSFDLMNLLQRKLCTVFHFHIRFSSRILNVSFIYGCRG